MAYTKQSNMKSHRTKGLTLKQQRFVEEYLVDLNATQAVIRAGYSARRASEIGYQLLQKPTVRQALKKPRERLSERIQVRQEEILQELARIAFSDIGEVLNWDSDSVTLIPKDKLSTQALSLIQEISTSRGKTNTVRVKLVSKEKALEMLCRYYGLFKDKVSVGLDAQTVELLLNALPKQFADGVRKRLAQRLAEKRAMMSGED